MATYTSNTFGVTVTGAEGVTGPITPDGQVTIAYDGVNGFGATGPTVDVFDDFRGADGASHSVSSPQVGTWDASSGTYETSESRSNGSCWRGYGNGSGRSSLKRYPTDTGEFFVSYALRLPNYHPGSGVGSTYDGGDGTVGTVGGTGEFPDTSAAKWLWVSDADAASPEVTTGTGSSDGRTDVVFPTMSGRQGAGTDAQAAVIQIQGNSGTNASDWKPDPSGDSRLERSAAWGGTNSGWWRWDEWMRFSFWVKAGADADVDAGNLYCQVISNTGGMKTAVSSGYPVFNGSNAETVNRFVLNAWYRNNDVTDTMQSSMDIYFDDFYLAVGGGAAARVEIGDNATYASCTDLALATVDSWSNTSLTCTLRSGAFANFSGKYIHIHDANNNYVGSSRLIS